MIGTRPTGRDDFGRRGYAKPALWGEPEQPKRCGLRANLARSRIAQVVTARPEVPGLGRLPNKRFSDFGRRAKFEKYASVATLALLAG